MAIIEINSILVGHTISFRTINTFDNVKRVGTVTGVVNYDVALLFLDIDTYHQQVLHTNPSIGTARDQQYFIISYKEGDDSSPSKTIAIAKSWLAPSSVELVEENAYLDFRVYNISATKATDVINLIKSLGYDVSLQ